MLSTWPSKHDIKTPISPEQNEFKANKEVREAMSLDPNISGKQLIKVAKQLGNKEDDDRKLSKSNNHRNRGTCPDAPHQIVQKYGLKLLKQLMMNI